MYDLHCVILFKVFAVRFDYQMEPLSPNRQLITLPCTLFVLGKNNREIIALRHERSLSLKSYYLYILLVITYNYLSGYNKVESLFASEYATSRNSFYL